MKFSINQQWLHLASFDSGAPSGGATVIHQFTEAGEYRVTFRDGENTLVETRLVVGGDHPAAASTPAHVTLDLTKIAYPSNLAESGLLRNPVLVTKGGYVSFSDSGKAKPFAVVAEPLSEHGAGFDSRRLSKDDIFALTLVRPGEYRVVNELTRSEGRITVAYPVIGTTPYRPPEPLSVSCSEDGFEPHVIELKPAQGLIFRIHAAARIRIDLTRPDDGPDKPAKSVASYSRAALLEAVERVRAARKKS